MFCVRFHAKHTTSHSLSVFALIFCSFCVNCTIFLQGPIGYRGESGPSGPIGKPGKLLLWATPINCNENKIKLKFCLNLCFPWFLLIFPISGMPVCIWWDILYLLWLILPFCFEIWQYVFIYLKETSNQLILLFFLFCLFVSVSFAKMANG